MIFDRIANSYQLSKSTLVDENKFYSRHWKRYYTNRNDKWEIALSDLARFLPTFRSEDGLSDGLDDAKLVKSCDARTLFVLIEQIGIKYIIENLPSSENDNVGSCPFTLPFAGKKVDFNELGHLYYARFLDSIILSKRFLGEVAPNVICEIGGGYGGLARIIISKHRAKYILIDLPEANILSSYYLSTHFPEKKIFLYEDYQKNAQKITKEIIEDNDIFILPPGCNFEEDLKVGLFINMRSMMEMEQQFVDEYFSFIHQHISRTGVFANFNRLSKVSNLANYPYDSNWKVIYDKPVPLQRDVIAFVAQRESAPSNCNIDKKLQEVARQDSN